MYFFLDTEWADPVGSELVSLALVSEDGAHRFYAERDPLPVTPTDFVRYAVYPLLERGRAAMSDQAMTTSLRTFLSAAPGPAIMADYPNDLALLRYVLDGFDLPDEQAAACGPIPRPILTHMLQDGATWMLVEDYFAAHAEQRARRHHAAVDAEALRVAWRIATRRDPVPSWSLARTRSHLDSLAGRTGE